MQFTINIFLALVWSFLHTSYTFVTLAEGFILGALIIFFMSKTLGNGRFYLRRALVALRLFGIFIKELFDASMQVLIHVLHPQLIIQPGIIKMDLYLDSPGQIVLLANMITLTPGTVTIEVTEDMSSIYIHALQAIDADEVCAHIEKTFERNIWEVFH